MWESSASGPSRKLRQSASWEEPGKRFWNSFTADAGGGRLLWFLLWLTYENNDSACSKCMLA